MKSIIFSTLLSLAFINGFAQSQTICRPGFSYTISKSQNWGLERPVITNINPLSNAESSGIQLSDVVLSIDGVDTKNITPEEIETLLNPINKDEILLNVMNLSNPNKQIIIRKECKKINAITEEQLASSFKMYSLETDAERLFVAPFKTFTTQDNVDFSTFKTFAFSPIDENNSKLETSINHSIEKDLIKKGLSVDVNRPDILIQTFYFFDKNPNFKGTNKVLVEKYPTYRYNYVTNKMEQVPFLNPSTPESEAQYLLQFGYRLIDQRDKPGRILWECEANELLDDSYRVDEYAKINVPLMGMQYPYVKYERNIPFIVNHKTFNYTGLSYDIDDLSKVITVDKNSPAAAAGFRNGDIILSINDNEMNNNAEELTAAYKDFITKTMKYRDPHTRFTDINGFKRCMFWDVNQYAEVAEAIKKSGDNAVFSYLYNYAPYVNPSGNNSCVFNVKRGKEKIKVTVHPAIKRSMQIEIK